MNPETDLTYFPALAKHQELAQELLGQLPIKDFEKGDVLLKEGDFVSHVPLVLEGLVKVYKEDEDGHEMLLYYIEKGESCIMSAMSCLKQDPSSIKAIVEADTQAILIPANKISEYERKFPGWNEFFWGLFQAKYQELLEIISMLTFSNKDILLWEYLKKRAAVKETTTLQITHQQVADDLGITREATSRLLKKLENQGRVQLGHGKIVVVGE